MTRMKSPTTLAYLVLFVFSLALNSCSKDDEIIAPSDVLTEQDAVELIESSLQKSTGGLSQTASVYSAELDTEITVNASCDSLYEETLPYTYNGNLIQANYTKYWAYQLACSNLNIPQTADFNASSTGTYSTPRIESDDVTQSSFTISGLQPTSDAFLFNGSYSREGSQQITINQVTRSINSTLSVEVIDLLLNKGTYEINSGTGTCSLTGSTDQGNTFLFEGDLVFNGNGTASLTVNGNTHLIELN